MRRDVHKPERGCPEQHGAGQHGAEHAGRKRREARLHDDPFVRSEAATVNVTTERPLLLVGSSAPAAAEGSTDAVDVRRTAASMGTSARRSSTRATSPCEYVAPVIVTFSGPAEAAVAAGAGVASAAAGGASA